MAERTQTLSDYRQDLNNYLQRAYREDPRHRLNWEVSQEGPGNRPTWQAIATLSGVEWGRGRGHTIRAAKEIAARNVLIALRERGPNL